MFYVCLFTAEAIPTLSYSEHFESETVRNQRAVELLKKCGSTRFLYQGSEPFEVYFSRLLGATEEQLVLASEKSKSVLQK